jgi:hypothetical protein
MGQGMTDKLVSYVLAMAPEEYGELALQDIALCLCAYRHGDPAARNRRSALTGVVRLWQRAVAANDRPPTAGRRQQVLLRDLIDVLQAAAVHALAWDEIAFLLMAHEIASEGEGTRLFDRVGRLIGPHVDLLAGRQASLAPAPDLPNLGKRLAIVTAAELAAQPKRAFTEPALFEEPVRAAFYEHEKGHLRILGTVPEEAVVCVNDGHCSVEGYVLGTLVCAGHVDVRENVSGNILSRQGDVRTRNVVDNSRVVVLQGQLVCMMGQNPRLVYAGQRIHLREDAALGRFVAPCIEVEGRVRGGAFKVSQRMAAHSFIAMGPNLPHIELAGSVDTSDFGQKPGPELRKLLSEEGRLRLRVERQVSAAEREEREANRLATLALLYLLGGEEARNRAELLRKGQWRLMALSRLEAGAASLESVLEQLSGDADAAEEPGSMGDALDQALADSDAAFEVLAQEGELPAEMAAERRSLRALVAPLRGSAPPGAADDIRTGLGRLIERWREEIRVLSSEMASLEGELQGLLERLRKGSQIAKAPRFHLLGQLLESARGRPADDVLARRARTPFLQLLARTVETRRRHARAYHQKAAAAQAELEQMRHELWTRYHIRLDRFAETDGAEVEGRFMRGVVIQAGSSAGPDGRLETANTLQRPVLFRRVGNAVVEGPTG